MVIRLLIFLLLTVNLIAANTDIDDRRKELESIRDEISKNRAEINKLSSKESNLMRKLKRIDNDIALITRYMKKLDDQEKALVKDIDYTQVILVKTSNSLTERKGLLRERMRSIYKKGRFDELDLLFNSGSISDYFRRNALFRYIAESDRALIKGITRKQKDFENTKVRLENRLDDVHAIIKERESQQAVLEKQKEARTKILSEVKGKKSEYLKQVKELQQRQADINRIIASLGSTRKKKSGSKPLSGDYGDFGKLHGKLNWPAKGSISKPYGTNVHPVYNTKTINYGIDIETAEGAQVSSVAEGEVAHTGVMGSFGNFVIVEHSDGFYTLYANLARVSVSKGGKVKAGSSLGVTGSSASADGAKLHFELRRERQVLDPTDWLE
ncbi:MAG: peptidoglycan DD-metalloendopeptidase family protein [Fibrobacteres bacterium]|nr:peptidoglycan DD-metalloendopeptidase family protein [Fibrobacterota bacterium]